MFLVEAALFVLERDIMFRFHRNKVEGKDHVDPDSSPATDYVEGRQQKMFLVTTGGHWILFPKR